MYYLLGVVTLIFMQLTPAISKTCTTPNNETAECISLYECPLFLKALSQVEISGKFIRSSTCGGDAANPMVCCGTKTVFDLQQNIYNLGTLFQYLRFLKMLPKPDICGLQHSDDFHHTVDGSALSEFPWLAKIYAENKQYSYLHGFYCGGTLINDRYVITAASCLLDSTLTLKYVRLGEYNSSNDTDCLEDDRVYECSEVQDFGIEEKIPHPEYTEYEKGCPFNDIGLIRLDKTVTYTDYVRPICLAVYSHYDVPINSRVVTTHCANVNIKEKLYLDIASVDSCKHNLPTEHPNATDGFLCGVTDTNITSCYDQIGNPLMFARKIRSLHWYLYGLVPGGGRGYSCYSEHKQPFTSIKYHLGWLADNIKEG